MSDPFWLDAAFAERGVKEISGSGSNERIEEYLATGTSNPSLINDAVAWCAGFANWCLRRPSPYSLAGTKSLMAKSFRNYGRPVSMVNPPRGAIAVFDRPPNPESGHVGFFLRFVGNDVEIIGGNQQDAVTVDRFPKSRLIALRWPNSVPISPQEAEVPLGSIPETPIAVREPTIRPPRPQASPQEGQPRQDSLGGLVVALVAAAAVVLFILAKKEKLDILEKIKDAF